MYWKNHEKLTLEFKIQKDCVSFLFGSNSNGSYKLKSLIIDKA